MVLEASIRWFRQNSLSIWLGATILGVVDVLVAALRGPLDSVGVLLAPLLSGVLIALPYAIVAASVEASLWLRERVGVRPGEEETGRKVAGTRDLAFRASAWLLAWALLLVFHQLLGVALSLQDTAFVNDLLPLSFALLLALAVLATPFLARAVHHPLRRIERHGALPWLRTDALGFGLFVWLPLVVVLSVFTFRHQETLGPVLWLVFAVLAWSTYRVIEQLRESAWGRHLQSAQRRRWPFLVAYLLVAATAATEPSFLASSSRWVHHGAFGDAITEVFGQATDFDGDGASAFFGGGDCAGFDAIVHPGAPDVAGNGVDEDCSGSDRRAQDETKAETFSRRLEPERIARYNIVWIVVDALRADRIEPKNDARIAPRISGFAETAWTFESAYSQSSATRISFPSFLTGLWPGSIEWHKTGRRYQVSKKQPMLQEDLRVLGYRTHFVTNRWFEQHTPSLTRGFDGVDDVWLGEDHVKGRRASAPVSTGRAIRAIEAANGKPFFLLVYFEGPHAPYENLSKHGVPDFGKKPEQRYDAEVHYADRHVGLLLDYLRFKEEVWRKTIVVVIGDHGEEFGEHGGKHHSRTCYVESVHVPLIVRVPGFEPERIDDPVALVDVVPTLFELLGEKPERHLDGSSLLLPVLDKAPTPRPLYCGLFSDKNPERTLERSVRLGKWMLYENQKGSISELYDTEKDPEEKHNLANDDAFKEQKRRLEAHLADNAQGTFRK